MPTIYDLKPGFQRLLRPLTHALFRVGITANTVTNTATIASIAYGTWMLVDRSSLLPFLLLPLFMLARMALNAIDGMLAREYRQQSRLGAILNETGDVISDAALYTPFALVAGSNLALIALIVFLSIMTEFVGVLGQIAGNSRRYDGPLGKSDRAFVFGALGLALGLGMPINDYLTPILTIIAALLAWTCINRARRILHSPA